MKEMSIKVHDGVEYEIVDRRARSTLGYLLDNVATTYAIRTEFLFVESSNDLLLVIAGKGYTTTLTAYEGYVLDPASVKVTMAGVDVTAKYYASGTLTIPAVTGDVVIAAEAVPDEGEEPGGGEGEEPEEPAVIRTVDLRKYNVTFSPEITQVYDGDDLDTVVSPIDGYEMLSVIVYMGGVNLTNSSGIYDAATGRIYIPKVTANVIITASAKKIETETPTVYHTVSGSLSNCWLDPSLEEVNLVADGDGYSTILKALDGYAFDSAGIKIEAVDGTTKDVTSLTLRDKVYEDGLLKQATVYFATVPGDVTITAAASLIHSVDIPEVEHVTVGGQVTKALSGGALEVTLDPDDGYTLVDVAVIMDGGNVTNAAYSTDSFGVGRIYLSPVLGDIKVTYSAVKNEVETFRVEHELTNVYASMTEGNVIGGSSYYVQLFANNDSEVSCRMSSVTVTMGGEDISDCYEGGELSGAVTIPEVTGNVVITAVAVPIYSVTVTDDGHVTRLNYDESITGDGGYENTFYLEAGYTFDTVTVKIGGAVKTGFFTAYDSHGQIKIPAEYVTGDIEIDVKTKGVSYPVVNTLSGVTSSNISTIAYGGQPYTAELTATSGTSLTVTVKMGGTDITSSAWTAGGSLNGIVHIDKVTGYINITATAT